MKKQFWKLSVGLTTALVIVSCGGSAPSAAPEANPSQPVALPEEDHHEHIAQHEGTLIVLGDEFAHVELVVDSATGRLTAYILDGEAENPIRVSQPDIEFELRFGETVRMVLLGGMEKPLTGEKMGATSEFSGIASELAGMERFEGRIIRIEALGSEFKNVEFRFPEGNEEDDKHGSEFAPKPMGRQL